MTLTWLDHLINKCLDLVMILSIPFVAWLFRYRIKRFFKNNDEKKKQNFKPEGMGM